MNVRQELLIWIAFWIFLGLFLFTAGARLFYPFQLEWMEGELLVYLERIAKSSSIYTAPTLEWIPFLDNFLYFHVVATLDPLISNGLISGRLISTIATLGTGVLLFATVLRLCKQRVCAFLAFTLFLASYVPSGAWLDLAKVDSLFLFFITLSLYGLFQNSPLISGLTVSIGLFLAFLVKQSALCIFPFFCLALLNRFKKAGIFSILILGLVLFGVIHLNDLRTDGWYSYYLFKLTWADQWITERYWTFFSSDLMEWFVPAILIAVIGWREDRSNFSSTLLLAVSGLVVCAYLSRIHNGESNVLMPAHLAIAITTSLGFGGILVSEKLGLRVMLRFLLFVQLLICVYNPLDYLPSKQDLQSNKMIINLLKKSPGDVWIPYHSYLTYLADKPQHAHALALENIKQNAIEGVSNKLKDQLLNKINDQDFSLILMDEDDRFGLQKALLNQGYRKIDNLFSEQNILMPVSGYRTRPQWIFLPLSQNDGEN